MALPRGLNWDSDVSELTPLEDSSGEDDLTSSDEDGELRVRIYILTLLGYIETLIVASTRPQTSTSEVSSTRPAI